MALPGRDKTFAFENCRDVLTKLEREIERYRVAWRDDDIEAMKDTAFNIAVTAWHLCDWVFGDLTADQRNALHVHTLRDMHAAALECRALHICRQVATASKHWETTRRPDPAVAVIVTAGSDSPIDVPAAPGVPLHVFPHWHIYFVDGEQKTTVDEIFDRALEFWTHYIYQNGIAKGGTDIPV